MIDWKKEASMRKQDILDDLAELIRCKSVKDLETAAQTAPMGLEIGKALDTMLSFCERDGFAVTNHAGYVGFCEYNPSHAQDYIAVLGHLDVVAASGDWQYEPFSLTEKNGMLYGRGVSDDKGPVIAAYYALRLIRDLKLDLKHSIRLIFGTDEESGSKCMRKYNELERPPLFGFTPDSSFPVVNAEKGQVNCDVVFKPSMDGGGSVELVSLKAGNASNSVADFANASLNCGEETANDVIADFEAFCGSANLPFAVTRTCSGVQLDLYGKAGHGAAPSEGVNAGLAMAHFLNGLALDARAKPFIACLDEKFYGDCFGERIGVAASCDDTGQLTNNIGVISYCSAREDEDQKDWFTINMRFPTCCHDEHLIAQLRCHTGAYGFVLDDVSVKQPYIIPSEHPVVKKLLEVYAKETGLEAYTRFIGGGTYASKINNGVCFGANFPGRDSSAHETNEHFSVEDLMSCTALYAAAIYALANLD